MFGKSILGIFVLSLTACAQPKYVRLEGNQNGEQTHSEQKADLSQPFQKETVYLSWYWEKKPTSTEVGSLIFKTYRPNQFDQSIVPQDLSGEANVLLWMPGMGHGSSPTKVERLDTGTYRASQVFFVMPGEWEIHFQSKTGNILNDETVVTLTL